MEEGFCEEEGLKRGDIQAEMCSQTLFSYKCGTKYCSTPSQMSIRLRGHVNCDRDPVVRRRGAELLAIVIGETLDIVHERADLEAEGEHEGASVSKALPFH